MSNENHFHIESESVDENNASKDNVLKNSTFAIDSAEVSHTTTYDNDYGQTASLEVPINGMYKTDPESLKQVPNNDYELSNVEDNTSSNSNTNPLQEVEINPKIQEDLLLNSAKSPAISSNNACSHPDNDPDWEIEMNRK